MMAIELMMKMRKERVLHERNREEEVKRGGLEGEFKGR
jgi:hypothetical protein